MLVSILEKWLKSQEAQVAAKPRYTCSQQPGGLGVVGVQSCFPGRASASDLRFRTQEREDGWSGVGFELDPFVSLGSGLDLVEISYSWPSLKAQVHSMPCLHSGMSLCGCKCSSWPTAECPVHWFQWRADSLPHTPATSGQNPRWGRAGKEQQEGWVPLKLWHIKIPLSLTLQEFWPLGCIVISDFEACYSINTSCILQVSPVVTSSQLGCCPHYPSRKPSSLHTLI